MEKLGIIILAGGKGTRMGFGIPKVLLPIGNLPMLEHVWRTAKSISNRVVIVASPVLGQDKRFAVQEEPLGSGHAALVGVRNLKDCNAFLFLLADSPLVTTETLTQVLSTEGDLVWIGFSGQGNYGRLELKENQVVAVVERQNPRFSQLGNNLCNSGALLVRGKAQELLSKITKNTHGEYFLTDLAKIATNKGLRSNFFLGDPEEFKGANNLNELAELEKFWQDKTRIKALKEGVFMPDPSSVFFSHDTTWETGVTIEPFVVIKPGVHLATKTTVKSFSYIEGCVVADEAKIGPFTVVRPTSFLGPQSQVGCFVEVKNSSLDLASKAKHLSYIGDVTIGEKVNIGAMVVFANYDGRRKNSSTIGNSSFIGSNSVIIAPTKIGDNCFLAAGTIIKGLILDQSFAIGQYKNITIKQNKFSA